MNNKELKYFIRMLGDSNYDVRERAVKALVRIGNPSVKPLIRVLGNSDFAVRKRASEALGQIGDASAVRPLIRLHIWDSDLAVRKSVVEALVKIGDAQEALAKIGNTRAIKFLVFMLKDERLAFIDKETWRRTIENIIDTNQNICKFYPYLFCTECFLMPKGKNVKLGLFKSYTHVSCRNCGSSSYLLKDVKQVVGLIGGDVKDYKQDGEKVYVNLWSEKEKKTRNADIDILEIHESNGISYDYAVNAVLNVLKNDVSRPRKYVKGIPVIIRGNPSLSDNSRMILEHEFAGIKTNLV